MSGAWLTIHIILTVCFWAPAQACFSCLKMEVTTGPVLLTSVRLMTMYSITLLSIRKIPRQFLYQRGACRIRVQAISSALATEVRIGKPYPECVASPCELWQLLLPILRSWWLAPWMGFTAARMVAAIGSGF